MSAARVKQHTTGLLFMLRAGTGASLSSAGLEFLASTSSLLFHILFEVGRGLYHCLNTNQQQTL